MFMAIPHYAYLVLKMPGPAGVITLHRDHQKAYECDRESSDLADITVASLEVAKVLQQAAELPQESDLPAPKTSKLTLEPDEKLTKTIQQDPGDSAKVTHIGAQLDPK